MSLHGVFADEELFGDFAVGEAGGDEAEDFEFAGSDAEGGEVGWVGREGDGGRDGRLGGYGLRRVFAGEGHAEPDAESGENDGDQAAVDFEGVFQDQEAVFGELQESDQKAAEEAEEKQVGEDTAARS